MKETFLELYREKIEEFQKLNATSTNDEIIIKRIQIVVKQIKALKHVIDFL